MTQTEFDHLKTTLTQGCTSERQELIWLMTPRQRAEFARSLVFAAHDPLQAATWRMLAVALAQDAIRQLDQIETLEACSDRFNAAYECEACELMERAASPAELAALEALHSATMNTDSLQGAL